jgi:uncharacterized protein (TIGR02646 family)
MKLVYDQLVTMAGQRGRCMFCIDSRGVEIDHFWPKAHYPDRAFLWKNMILVCGACNRGKSDHFEVDANGSPMLIDPTDEEPWDHLYYDSRTGIITARFMPTGEPEPRGVYTVECSNLPLNIEQVTEGRLRTQRNIERCVDRFLESMSPEGAHDPREQELFQCLQDNDDYGLRTWFLFREGRNGRRFEELRTRFPSTWATLESP